MPGIACPICGDEAMAVKDTRPMSNYIRRRRICSKLTCKGRLTTIELPHPGPSAGLEDAVAMPRAQLRAICQDILRRIDAEPDEDE